MPPALKILCVEPLLESQELLQGILSAAGYQAFMASTLAEALRLFQIHAPALVLVDMDLPHPLEGLDLCRRLRAQSNVIIMVLAAHDGHFVEALEQAGADAYAVKPIKPKHLVARVHALLRRFYQDDGLLNIGPLRLDVVQRRFYINRQEVYLTIQEFALMEAFMRYPGRALSRVELLNMVWHTANVVDRVVDVNISNLRRKVPLAAKHIVSVRTIGYRFEA